MARDQPPTTQLRARHATHGTSADWRDRCAARRSIHIIAPVHFRRRTGAHAVTRRGAQVIITGIRPDVAPTRVGATSGRMPAFPPGAPCTRALRWHCRRYDYATRGDAGPPVVRTPSVVWQARPGATY